MHFVARLFQHHVWLGVDPTSAGFSKLDVIENWNNEALIIGRGSRWSDKHLSFGEAKDDTDASLG